MIGTRQALQSYQALKGERNYWFYLISCLLSRMGDSIDVVAYSWIAYQLTGSAVWLTVVASVNVLPTIFLTPLIAPVVERMNKKRIIVATSLLRAAMVLLTGILMLLNLLTPQFLLVVTFLNSVIESCSDPAYMASIPLIIPSDKLDAGIALRAVVSQGAQLVGKGVGGVCIGLFGSGGTLLMDASLFFLSALALSTLRLTTEEPRPLSGLMTEERGYFTQLKGGFQYFLKRPQLVFLCFFGVGLNIFIAPQVQLQTAYVVEVLHLDAYALSVMGVASAVGMLVGSVIYPIVKTKLSFSKIVLLCGGTGVLQYTVFVLLGSLVDMEWLKYGVLLVISGAIPFGEAVFSLMANVLFYRLVDREYLSRMASIFNAITMCAIPLASLYSGALVSVMSVSGVYAVSAVAILVSTFLVVRMRSVKALEALAQETEAVSQ